VSREYIEGSTPLCLTPPAAVISFGYPLSRIIPLFLKKNKTLSPTFLLYYSQPLITLTFSLKSLLLFKDPNPEAPWPPRAPSARSLIRYLIPVILPLRTSRSKPGFKWPTTNGKRLI
jgi:hypothetical protein